MVRSSNRGWYLVELRDLKPEAIAERLRLARQATQYRDFGGLILDDLPAAALPKLALQFALLSEAVRQVDGGLAVTAYGDGEAEGDGRRAETDCDTTGSRAARSESERPGPPFLFPFAVSPRLRRTYPPEPWR